MPRTPNENPVEYDDLLPEEDRPPEAATEGDGETPARAPAPAGRFRGLLKAALVAATTVATPAGAPAQPPGPGPNPPAAPGAAPARPGANPERPPNEAEDLRRFDEAVLPKAENIGTRVSGPETRAQWLPILQEINKVVPPFRGVPTRTPAEELELRYSQLNESRRHLRTVLMAVALRTRDDQELSADAKDRIGRAIAWYLRDLKEYRDRLGQAGAMTPPNFLTKHLELSPQEGVAHEVTSRMLAMQYDITQANNLTGSPREFASKTREISLRAMQRKHITIADAYASVKLDTDDGYRVFLRKCDIMVPDAREIAAAEIFLRYLKKHEASLQRSLPLVKKTKVEDMSISEAVVYLQAGDVSAYMQEIGNSMKNLKITDLMNPENVVDLPALLEKASSVNDVFSTETSRMMIVALLPDAATVPPEELNGDVQAVITFMRGRTAESTELKSIESNMGNLTGRQQQLVRAIKTEVMKAGTTDELLSALFLPANVEDNGTKALREKARAAIERRIRGGELTTKEAFELFFWLKSPVKSPLVLGSKTITILGAHQEVDVAQDLKLHQFDELANLILSNSDELEAELNKMGLTDEQKVEMRNAVLYLKESGTERFLNWKDMMLKAYAKHPIIGTLILLFFGGGTLIALGKGAAAVGRLYVRTKVSDLTKFATMTPDQVKALADKAGIPVAQVEAARAEVAKCMDEFNLIQAGRVGVTPTAAMSTVSIPVPGTGVNVPVGAVPFVTDKARRKYRVRQEANAIRATFLTQASLTELTKAMKARYPEWKLHELAEVMKAPSGFNKTALRTAMVEAGYTPTAVDEALGRVYFSEPLSLDAAPAMPEAAPVIDRGRLVNSAARNLSARGIHSTHLANPATATLIRTELGLTEAEMPTLTSEMQTAERRAAAGRPAVPPPAPSADQMTRSVADARTAVDTEMRTDTNANPRAGRRP